MEYFEFDGDKYPIEYGKINGRVKQETTDGRQLLDCSTLTQSTNTNGISINYDNESGIITLDGTCTQNNTVFFFNKTLFAFKANINYRIKVFYISGSVSVSNESSGTPYVQFLNSTDWSGTSATLRNKTLTGLKSLSKDTNATYNGIRIDEGQSFNNYKFKLLLQEESEEGISQEWEPYSGKKAVPNTDNPQEIKTIQGITNEFDINKYICNGQIGGHNNKSVMIDGNELVLVSNGVDTWIGNVTATEGTTYNVGYGQLFKIESEEYSIILTNLQFDKNYVQYWDANKKTIGTWVAWNGKSNFTFHPPANAKYFSFRFGKGSSVSGEELRTKIILVKGSMPKKWVPYGRWLPRIQLDDNLQEKEILIDMNRKDIFDINAFMADSTINNFYTLGNNELTINARDDRVWDNIEYKLEVKPGFPYCCPHSNNVNVQFSEYNSSNIFLGKNAYVEENGSYLTSKDCKYLKIKFFSEKPPASSPYPITIPIPKIYEGSSPYYEFGSVDLSNNENYDIYDQGYLTKKVEKIIINGGEPHWSWFDTTVDGIHYIFAFVHQLRDLAVDTTSNNIYCISDRFKGTSKAKLMEENDTICSWNSGSNWSLCFHSDKFSNLDEAKAWFAENPTAVYYLKGIPETIDISSEETNEQTYFNNTLIDSAYFNGTELDYIYFNGQLVYSSGYGSLIATYNYQDPIMGDFIENFEYIDERNLNSFLTNFKNAYQFNLQLQGNLGRLNEPFSFSGFNKLYTLSLDLNIKSKNFISIDNLFNGCTSLENINFTNFNSPYFISARNLFRGCSNLQFLNLNNWNIPNVISMYGMFYNCSKLTNLNISNWNTSKVTSLLYMFSGCRNLVNLNISNWDISNVIDVSFTFQGCSNLTSLNVSNWNVSKVTDLRSIFMGCYNLINLDISNWNISNIIDTRSAFGFCNHLTKLDLSKWNTSKLTNVESMFSGCRNLFNLNLNNWNIINIKNMYGIFQSCENLTNLNLFNWNTLNTINMANLFCSCQRLRDLDISNWNTSNVISMNNMFRYCSNLTNLNISNWNTSKVKDMSWMFSGCHNLNSLDLSKWNTVNVNNTYDMFASCSNKMINLNLSNWNVSNVKNMGLMFIGCTNLVNLNLSNWNLSNIENIYLMFGYLENLSETSLKTIVNILPIFNATKFGSNNNIITSYLFGNRYNETRINNTFSSTNSILANKGWSWY